MIKKIVLTGAAGKLGRRLRQPLAAICEVLVSSDIVPLQPVAGNELVVSCDLADGAAVDALLEGADAVVHFAGYPREASWDVILPANILSVTNLWEAAVKHGVRRIVYASTNHVVGFHPVDQHIDVNAEIKCDSRYGVSKAFTEIMARFYYEKFGVESLGIRIGRCEDLPTDERMMSTWVHPEDLTAIVKLGIEGRVAADVVYGLSNNAKGWCSNPPQAQFPFQPRHSADDYRLPDQAVSGTGSNWPFQGGPFAANEYVGEVARAAEFYRVTPNKEN
jgi:uronate dehydrogenase